LFALSKSFGEFMLSKLTALAAFVFVSSTGIAQTQLIEVKNAWVRTAVPGQTATGAFMTITHKDGARLVRGVSPVAGVTEIHEMKMEGDVMKMRALPQGVELPAGRAVDLVPGGYHIMLMDLKNPLPKDAVVPITLWFKDAKGVESQMELKLPVAARAPNAKPGAAMSEHKH
jgi:periplasmic copper chaperone A